MSSRTCFQTEIKERFAKKNLWKSTINIRYFFEKKTLDLDFQKNRFSDSDL